MGTLTLEEMQAEYLAALGGRTDHTSTLLTRRLNLAQERLARLHDFEEMQVTTTTTWAYTGTAATDKFLPLPDSYAYIRELHSVVLEDTTRQQKMKRVLTRTWDKVIGNSALNPNPRMPYWYHIWDYNAGRAEGYPVPEKAYTVTWRFTQWPTPLALAADKSRFRFKDELITELAIIYSLDQLGKEDESAKHQTKFRNLFIEALTTDTTKPDVELPTGLESFGNTNPWVGEYWKNPWIKEMP